MATETFSIELREALVNATVRGSGDLLTVNCTATQTWSTHSISSLAHERRVHVDLRTVATETFSIELREALVNATVRGYHVYQDSRAGCSYRVSHIVEQLPCTREPGTRKDPFAVAVVRSSVECYRVTTTECARRPALLV